MEAERSGVEKKVVRKQKRADAALKSNKTPSQDNVTSDKFHRIEAAYREFDRGLLRQGKLPLRPTSRGFWSPAIMSEVFEAFQKIGLGRYSRFLDIGSGDGRVVLIASLFVPRAEGIEIDQELHMVSLSMAEKLGLAATFRLKDLFAHDLSGYDVLFLSPDTPLERGMEQKLLAEMNGILIHHGHHFQPLVLEAMHRVSVNGTPFTLYKKSRKEEHIGPRSLTPLGL